MFDNIWKILTTVNACVRELAPRPMVKLFSLIEQIEILMYKLINFSKQAFFSEPTSICFPKSYMGQNTQISFSYSYKNNVFSYSFEDRNGILLPKLFWPTVRKNVQVIEKNFWKVFEIPRTIYSNSERSDQFLKQNAFLTCSWRFIRSNVLE